MRYQYDEELSWIKIIITILMFIVFVFIFIKVGKPYTKNCHRCCCMRDFPNQCDTKKCQTDMKDKKMKECEDACDRKRQSQACVRCHDEMENQEYKK